MECPSIMTLPPLICQQYSDTLTLGKEALTSWGYRNGKTNFEGWIRGNKPTVLPPLAYVLDAIQDTKVNSISSPTISRADYRDVAPHISPRGANYTYVCSPRVPTASLIKVSTDTQNYIGNDACSPRCQRRNCQRAAKRNDIYCKWHVDSRICRMKGCEKSSKAGGYCISHGGGKRCQHPKGCNKSAKQGGLCIAHGGGIRCKIQNCPKSAVCNGLCVAHGGSRKPNFKHQLDGTESDDKKQNTARSMFPYHTYV